MPVAAANGCPGLPRDAQNERRHRKSDQRISPRESERDNQSGPDHPEADVRVGAGVMPVGDERRAVQPFTGSSPDSTGGEVTEIANSACRRERQKMVRCAGMQESVDGFKPRDTRADEDRADHEQSRASLGTFGSHPKCHREGHRGQRIADVVHQVGQQSDAAARDEHHRLYRGGHAKNHQRQRDCSNPGT
jgi:hypothetical protein